MVQRQGGATEQVAVDCDPVTVSVKLRFPDGERSPLIVPVKGVTGNGDAFLLPVGKS